VRDDVLRSAAPVADAPVKRLDREAAGRIAGDERVEPTAEAVNLDDVADVNALEPHRFQG
jgi:hypothetical protein